MAHRDLGNCNHRKHYQVYKLTEKILNLLKNATDDTIDVCDKTTAIDIVSGRKNKIESELLRAKKAYLAGVFELDEYTEIKSKLENELGELNSINIEDNSNEIRRKELSEKIKTVLDGINNLENIIEQRNLLFTIVKEIKIAPESIEIVYNI